jgi:hypothetical protein
LGDVDIVLSGPSTDVMTEGCAVYADPLTWFRVSSFTKKSTVETRPVMKGNKAASRLRHTFHETPNKGQSSRAATSSI